MFSSKSSTKHSNSKKYQYNHVKNKRNHKKAQFLATTQHIQFTKHYFDFESKKLYGNRCRSSNLPQIDWKCAGNES